AGPIARADVAHFILDAIEHRRWIAEAPLLTR
ncbi:MAG: flavin reductase, partial [Sphingomonadaceae bacterium]|nr:flavin reductase [Sphingomonadaceae bacterium]